VEEACLGPLLPWPAEETRPELHTYVGPLFDREEARHIALGIIDPHSLEPYVKELAPEAVG
jgi:hypothetical protein